MHEMALVRNIVDIVVEETEAADVAEVRAVHVVIGDGRDIVEDYFESLFQFLARGTVAEHAEIILYSVPYRVQCNQCGAIFNFKVHDPESWKCPECGAHRDYKLVSGLELYISKIDVIGREPNSTAANHQKDECEALV